jgi:hypothetical protein
MLRGRIITCGESSVKQGRLRRVKEGREGE